MRSTRTSIAFVLVLALLPVAPARGDLLETFDPVTVPATAVQNGTLPPALVLPANAGSTGDFLRLINYGVNDNRNFYAFDQTDVGGFPTIVAEFDFRASNTANPADGFSLRFIPTWLYGTTGPGTPGGTGVEEPNIADVFAIGIDLYPEGDPRNDVSVHWDGVERANVTIPPATLDLNSGQFHRARVEWNNLGGASDVSVSIIPDINGTPGAPVPVVTNLLIPGLSPYDHRIELAARTGGATVDFDVDNVSVAYTAPSLQFFQDFDGGGTPGTLSQDNSAPGPQNQGPDAGSTGQFLRLINNGVNNQNNSIAFDQAAEQQLNSPGGMATFDFRCSDDGNNEADGFAMVFLPTDTYGVTGPGAAFTAEEPNVAGALAIGFDFHPQTDAKNDVSVHWNGVELVNVEVPRSVLDLNTNQFHQAQVRWTPDETGTNVSVWVVPDINGTPGDPVGVVGGIHIPIDGLYSHRVQFRGRTGGLNMDVDLDNIDADYAVVQPPPGPGFFQDFDSPGTTLYSVQGVGSGSGPVVRPPNAGSTGYFMQLLTDGSNSQRNSIAFDQVEEQLLGEPYNIVTFDFRATNKSNPADGFSMLFLPTSLYGTTGPGAPTAGWVPEEPNVPGVLAIGFDLYPDQNDVSVHWNGVELLNVDVPPGVLDLNSGQFHQAQVVWTTKDGASNVRVSIIPDINGTPGDPIDIVSGLHVPAIGRYSHRIEFTGRTGGANFGLDLDNMAAQYVEEPRDFYQDFDGPAGTAYGVRQLGSAPGPARLPGDAGSTGGFLRLVNDGVNSQNNAIAFDQAWNQSAPYPTNVVNIVDFDFRGISGDAPADGFSMLFLPSQIYGTTGPGAAGTFTAENPNVPNVLAIGFDLYVNGPPETGNDLSLHWDGTELFTIALDPVDEIDLDAGVFHHAMIRWEGIPGGSLVTVSLVPDVNGLIGAEITPIVDYFIPGLDAYPYRLEFVGRTGGLNMSIDLDNITVLFLPEPASFTLCGLGLLALARRRRKHA